ncbi:hypothetical protein [Flagellimonas sp.]
MENVGSFKQNFDDAGCWMLEVVTERSRSGMLGVYKCENLEMS